MEDDYTVAPNLDDPEEGTEEPGLDELLDDLDEERRAAIQARIDAAAQAQAQAAIDRMKGANGRWGNAHNQLQALGLTVDERGNVAAADPTKLTAYVDQFRGGQQQQQAKQDEEEIYLDPYASREELTEQARKLYQRDLQRAVAERTSTLEQKVDMLLGLVAQGYQERAPDAAREALAEFELDHLADTEEFQKVYRQMVSQLPPDQQADREALGTTAMVAARFAKQEMQKAGRDWRRPAARAEEGNRRPDPRATAGAAARAGLAQTGASRSSGGGQRGGQGIQLSEADQRAMELMGIDDPEEYVASQDPTGNAYRQFMARRAKQGRR